MIFTDLNEKGINFYSWPPLKPLTAVLAETQAPVGSQALARKSEM